MAEISCPRCGGTGEERSSGLPCGFCKGAGRVEVDDKELLDEAYARFRKAILKVQGLEQFCAKLATCERVERLRERRWGTDAGFNIALYQLCGKCSDYQTKEEEP